MLRSPEGSRALRQRPGPRVRSVVTRRLPLQMTVGWNPFSRNGSATDSISPAAAAKGGGERKEGHVGLPGLSLAQRKQKTTAKTLHTKPYILCDISTHLHPRTQEPCGFHKPLNIAYAPTS